MKINKIIFIFIISTLFTHKLNGQDTSKNDSAKYYKIYILKYSNQSFKLAIMSKDMHGFRILKLKKGIRIDSAKLDKVAILQDISCYEVKAYPNEDKYCYLNFPIYKWNSLFQKRLQINISKPDSSDIALVLQEDIRFAKDVRFFAYWIKRKDDLFRHEIGALTPIKNEN